MFINKNLKKENGRKKDVSKVPYLNLRLVHTYLDIFEKKGEKRRTVKWMAKGTTPPLIEYQDLDVCNRYSPYQPSKGEGIKHANDFS